MSQEKPVPTRFIGLDVHKPYLVAIGVDAELNQVLGPRRVPLAHLDSWMGKALTLQDAVVLEMTTNAFQLYDDLLPHVHSVTLVHPPHVTLITRAQVMTDKMAALVRQYLEAQDFAVGKGILDPGTVMDNIVKASTDLWHFEDKKLVPNEGEPETCPHNESPIFCNECRGGYYEGAPWFEVDEP
jgi:hypothetical protein